VKQHIHGGDDNEAIGMYYLYFLPSKPYGTLYIGVTSDLPKRIYKRKGGIPWHPWVPAFAGTTVSGFIARWPRQVRVVRRR
jgi:hypothetical protein